MTRGIADLRSYDLESRSETILTDGIFDDIWFMDSISSIYVRADGNKIMFSAHASKHSLDL
jgi:hypothetical protein